MKKWLAMAAAAAMMFGAAAELPIALGQSTAVQAADYTEGTYELLKYRNYGDYIEISSCDMTATEVTIPSEIDGVAVTSIMQNAFTTCDNLISITIPDSVTNVGEGTFSWCNSLTEIHVGEGNSAYTSIDGVLFNAEITELLCYPPGKSGDTYSIPDTVTIIGQSAFSDCGLTSITIPDSVESIGNIAFANCDNLTSITIPNGVTDIGYNAFVTCESLTSITIPNSVTSIRSGAFSLCSSLTGIHVDEGNRSYASIDGVLFNADTTELLCYPTAKAENTYSIPDSVTSIGDSAFQSCNLTSVIFSNSITNIKGSAFENCDNLTTITIPDSVTSIGLYAFRNCDSLTSITIPNSVTNIRSGAFNSCDALTDIYYSGTEEEWAAMEINDGSDELLNVTIHYDPTVQDGNSILGDMNEDGVIDIVDAVCVCNAIAAQGAGTSEEDFSASSGDVNQNGMLDMNDMMQIYVYFLEADAGLDPEFQPSSPFPRDEVYTVSFPDTITVTPSIMEANDNLVTLEINLPTYDDNPDFEYTAVEFGVEVDERCTIIEAIGEDSSINGSYDISYDNNIIWYCIMENPMPVTIAMTVLLPEDAKPGDVYDIYFVDEHIRTAQAADREDYVYPVTGNNAAIWVDWDDLSAQDKDFEYEITGNSVAIVKCNEDITEVVIPAEIEGLPVTTIEAQAFYYCKQLTSVTLPDSITRIETGAFRDCTNLVSINIPDSVTFIGGSAFSGCSNLAAINIPNGITTISSAAFAGCKSLTAILLPNSITSIEGSAFDHCSGLTSIEIPDSVTRINSYAFWGCDGLTEIILPKGMTTLFNHTFFECSSLTTVTIPNTITTIEYNIFDRCTKLSDIYYEGTEEEWNAIAMDQANTNLLNATVHFIETSGTEKKQSGDANGDNDVTILDVIALNKNLLAGGALSEQGKLNADVDGDGTPTTVDSMLILKYVIKLIDSFTTA